MADDLSVPRAPAKGLLDLPHELLTTIVREIAPLGGWKAQELRLVNRHLAAIATPIVFASLIIPDGEWSENDELFAALFVNRKGIREAATSLTYELYDDGESATGAAALEALPNLRRIHLSTSCEVTLPEVVRESLVRATRLHTLCLTDIRVDAQPYGDGSLLTACKDRVRHLILNRTSGDGVFASEAQNDPDMIQPQPSNVEVLEVYNPEGPDSIGSAETRYIVLTLYTYGRNARHITLEWNEAAPSSADDDLAGNILSNAAKSLRIQGLPSLFHAKTNPATHLTTSAYIVTFLNSIGTSLLPMLWLPVTDSFDLNPILFDTRMPKVQYLGFATPPAAEYVDKPDLLSAVRPLLLRSL
ncbi:hypothetical protein P7C70_g7358, partial [Phenoliferia sp. Uapishka_3]